MSLDKTPWAVGGGAVHQPETVRQALYDSTNGAEGISSIGALRVAPTAVPGGKVRALTGGALILNRYQGGDGQTYSARNMSQTEVPISPTGSGAGRTDLIVLRILDPQYEGEPPEDPTVFDYTRFEVIEGVPAQTETFAELNLNYPAIPLAKVTLPKSTATVTAAMIVDLREVAQPRTKPDLRTYALTAGDSENLTTTTGGDGQETGGQTWPTAVENAWQTIYIPKWATRAKIIMTWAGVRSTGGEVHGETWVQVGATTNPDRKRTQTVRYDTEGATNISRMTLIVADQIWIPKELRGTSQKFYPRGKRGATSAGGKFLTLDGGSAMVLQIEFMERAD